jgi:hypothetical protein
MKAILGSLPVLALALLPCCSSDDDAATDDGQQNTGGTSTGGTSSAGASGSAGSGTGGQAGSGGDAGSGGSSGSGSGGACEPESEDGACNACLKSRCCDVWPACEADGECAACSACLDDENDLGMCLIMTPPICNNTEMPTFDLLGCALEECVAECGLD